MAAITKDESGATVITVLNSWEEEACLRTLKKTALKNCSKEVAEFAECSKHGTIRVFFACRDANKAMNQCLRQYTTDGELDRLREKALEEKIQRLRATQTRPVPDDEAAPVHPIFRRNMK
ncbi:hypothetical protein SeMB42_g06720 [Synchytrium endobioticum]|uniref:COX assembly mitochondrial protein n=1 Tax=Synchytrium endobioticum TaxID=286115 RepID=A0A507D7V6_9FUNG|nr:hypothetical protein SeMB42_g06720 [Synchytrium endobioticum]TPX46930.1 hypothetical protein SeLEV6574_g02936 [Synchytrium endobioticum]